MSNTTENNVNREAISFSNKQMFNRRTVTHEGKEINLVSVMLPQSAEHKGFYIDLNEKFVSQSKFNDKMSFSYFDKDRTYAIYKYDKETNEKEKVVISFDDLKAEFNSWQSKEKNADKSEKEASEEVAIEDNDDLDDIEM